jgi:hypothetical protein
MTFHSELQYYLRYIYINTACIPLNISYCKKKNLLNICKFPGSVWFKGEKGKERGGEGR